MPIMIFPNRFHELSGGGIAKDGPCRNSKILRNSGEVAILFPPLEAKWSIDACRQLQAGPHIQLGSAQCRRHRKHRLPGIISCIALRHVSITTHLNHCECIQLKIAV